MEVSIGDLLLDLIEKICVVVLFSCIINPQNDQTPSFVSTMSKGPS